MDKLEKMIAFQKSFQEKLMPGFNPDNMTYDEKIAHTKNYILYCHEELTEVLQSLKHKAWHKYEKEYDEESTKEEIIDCFKFVLNLGILWGLDADEFEQVFAKKSDINLLRLKSNV